MKERNAVIIGIAAFALIPVGFGFTMWNQWHLEDATVTVERKERLANIQDGKTTYKNFVYTSDDTYVVKDSLFNAHWRAGTVYAQIKEGATCRVRTSGHRFGFLSMYKNIIAADCDG